MSREKVLKEATLCFLVTKLSVLLAMKTEKIGEGCWNGWGGGLRKEEKPRTGAVRELKEECKVIAKAKDLEKVAVINFHNRTEEGLEFTCKVHVYFCRIWKGSPMATKTMDMPMRFAKTKLPLDVMMPADRIWLPLVLAGEKLIAEFWYGPHQKELEKGFSVTFVDDFDD